MVRSVVSTWYGTFLVDGATVVRTISAPDEPAALAERARLRREGRLTPEEEQLLSERKDELWTTRDRRLAERGLRLDVRVRARPEGWTTETNLGRLREALLRDAGRSLDAAWDPIYPCGGGSSSRRGPRPSEEPDWREVGELGFPRRPGPRSG